MILNPFLPPRPIPPLSGSFPDAFPVSPGRDSLIFFKRPGKIVRVRKPAPGGNGSHGQAGCVQKNQSLAYAGGIDIVCDGHVRLFFEQAGKIAGGHRILLGKNCQGQFLDIVKINVVHAASHQKRVGLAGIVVYQHTVFAQHRLRQAVKLLYSKSILNLDGKLPGQVVNVQGMDMAGLNRFS